MGNILTSLFSGCVAPMSRHCVASGKCRKQSWPDSYSSRYGTVTVVALSVVSVWSVIEDGKRASV
jgi:hypothetical protein